MSFMSILNLFELGFFAYLAIGIGFSILFFSKGIARLDSASRSGSRGFRFFIFPGVVAFWPFFAIRKIVPGEASEVQLLDRIRKIQGLYVLIASTVALIVITAAISSRASRVDPEPPIELLGK